MPKRAAKDGPLPSDALGSRIDFGDFPITDRRSERVCPDWSGSSAVDREPEFVKGSMSPVWVKPGKAQIEHKFSGVPPATDIRQRDWHVGAICRHMQTYADIQTPGDAIILDLMNCRR